MIISMSGSQGQGKTTVLNSMIEKGYKVVEQKTSRSILNEWGYTLNEVNKYAPLTKQFQEEIIERHFRSIAPHVDSDEVVFIERSFADIFGYALFALGSFNEYSTWLDEYYERCLAYQDKLSHVLYLTGREITPEEDGCRSTNKHFARAVDVQIQDILRGMVPQGKLQIIDTPNHERRVTEVVIAAASCEAYRELTNAVRAELDQSIIDDIVKLATKGI